MIDYFPVPLLPLIAIAAIGLLGTGFISAGEAAVLRSSRSALAEDLAAAEHAHLPNRIQRIRRAQTLAADPPKTVAALAIIRSIAQMAGFAALTMLAMKLVPRWWQVLLLMAVIGLIVGLIWVRYSPRQLGFRRPNRILLKLAPFLYLIYRSTGWAAIPSPRQLVDDEEHNEQHYREIVDRVGESPGIEEDERELIKSVFEFGDTLVREVMVPRTEMVTIPATSSLRKVLRLFLHSGYSRVPITGESVDDIRGIVYLKDVAKAIDDAPLAADRPATLLVREAMFIPESKPVDDLLREMQASQTHIAVAVDEYGGIAGLLTVEDILEELVGELVDEHDSEQHVEPEQVAAGVWRVSARMPVDELGELFDLRLIDNDVDTVGGLLAKSIGKVPLVGSEGEIDGLHLVAERVQGRRRQIATVLVSKIKEQRNDRDE